MVKSVFGARLVPKATGLSSTVAQLDRLRKRPERLLQLWGPATETNVFSDDIFANNYANTPDLNKMIAHNTALAAKLKTQSAANSNKLTKMSWTLINGIRDNCAPGCQINSPTIRKLAIVGYES
jgi:hypothetical protein